VVLTIIIQGQKGEDRGSLALANIVASFFNLVVKVLEAIKDLYDMTKDKRNLITTFKGHKFGEPIFVGKLSGTQTYVSASKHEVKVWKLDGCSWTGKREMWSFPVNNGMIEVKCMAVLGSQRFLLAWQCQNVAQGTTDVHVYNYGDGTTSPITSSPLQHDRAVVFSVAVLSDNQIVVAAGSAETWELNASGKWTRSPLGDYGNPDSVINLAAKFGDNFLLTAAEPRAEHPMLTAWQRNPRGVCCSFDHTDNVPVQNMFELGYEERENGACSGRFVTHCRDKCVRVWKFENITRPPDLEIVLATDAFSMGIVGSGVHRRLLIGSIKGTVSFWKVGPLVLEKVVSAHRVPVTCLSQSEDNELLTGSTDRTIRLWRYPNSQNESSLISTHIPSIES
jgi:WD40 repeat protein